MQDKKPQTTSDNKRATFDGQNLTSEETARDGLKKEIEASKIKFGEKEIIKGPLKSLIKVREGLDKEVQDMINMASRPMSRNFATAAGVKTGIGKLNLDISIPTKTFFNQRTQRQNYVNSSIATSVA